MREPLQLRVQELLRVRVPLRVREPLQVRELPSLQAQEQEQAPEPLRWPTAPAREPEQCPETPPSKTAVPALQQPTAGSRPRLRQHSSDDTHACPFTISRLSPETPAASLLAVVVYLECDDLDAQVRELVDRGIVFDEPPTDRPWLWREARLRDPDGNVLCLFRAGENRKSPPWRLPPA